MQVLKLLFLLGQIQFILGKNTLSCPAHCTCQELQNFNIEITCDGSNENANSTYKQCSKHFQFNNFSESLVSRVSHLTVSCFNLSTADKTDLINFDRLTSLNIENSYFKQSPVELFGDLVSLEELSIKESSITDRWLQLSKQLPTLKSLQLCGNNIQQITIESSNLLILNLSNNGINKFQPGKHLAKLQSLDISSNPVKLEGSKLNLLLHLSSLNLSNTSLQAQISKNLPPTLPQNLSSIAVSHNGLIKVPDCDGLLAGVARLTSIDLRNNDISFIEPTTFHSQCYKEIQSISLASNKLHSIENTFNYLNHLTALDVSYNYLQHFPIQVFDQFQNQTDNNELILNGNTWSCDCHQIVLQSKLIASSSSLCIICDIPSSLSGKDLVDVSTKDLLCTEPIIEKSNNVSVQEYDDGKLFCSTSAVPRPIVTWMSPLGEFISGEVLQNDEKLREKFRLSPFGDVLTVRSVRLDKTGIYRCFAMTNNISVVNATVALSVYLSHTSTVIYIVVACAAFMVAIVVNSINMCMYIYEHLEKKRLYKKAVREQEEQLKLNPPIKQKSKLKDQSLASLNAANRYYGRYDYRCQNMFLDSFIKGAHTVKKTIYDARHSEFSNNMWEYAAHIKDRLHIEMPGVNMPNITMPTISMPTISMPSIPTIQDINTNIEKLSSSMMQRSQTLATSVGSVFTLKKRWMWQNSSDTESRDSDDNLEEAGLTRVTVHVHNNPTSPEHSPSHQDNTNNRADESTSSFTEADHPSERLFDKNPSKFVRFSPQHGTSANQNEMSQNVFVVPTPSIASVSGGLQLHSYESSV